jgi:hypothetical protein
MANFRFLREDSGFILREDDSFLLRELSTLYTEGAIYQTLPSVVQCAIAFFIEKIEPVRVRLYMQQVVELIWDSSKLK